MMKIFSILCVLGSLLLNGAPAQELEKRARIVFLGDSITHAGRYVELFEGALISQRPDERHEVINVGLSSETVSGLSEEGHAGGAFPRPDLMERLDRVLAKTKPDVVVACYGMNCGIYKPLDDARFAAYKKGIQTLRDKVTASGAMIVHLTPPVFDALPNKAKLLPAGLDAYPQPYVGYDDVLAAYGKWLMEKSKSNGWVVLDLHSAMASAIQEKRKADASFTFAKDGVHPNEDGQKIIFQTLLPLWKLGAEPPKPEVLALVEKKQRMLKDAWISEIGHKRPGVKAGLPLAEAQAKADALDAEARTAAK